MIQEATLRGKRLGAWMLSICLLSSITFSPMPSRAETLEVKSGVAGMQDAALPTPAATLGTTAAPSPTGAAAQTARPLSANAAKILSGAPIADKKISIIFEGSGTAAAMDAIVKALDAHGVKSTFFLPAIATAEQPDIARGLVAAGHTVGNYLLSGEKRLQEMPEEKQRNLIIRSQEVMAQTIGTAPDMFRGNVTVYTDGILSNLGDAGIRYALSPSAFVNHSSFRDPSQAAAFAAKLTWGTLLSVKVNQYLEADELPVNERPTEKPSPEVTPGPKIGREASSQGTVEERMLNVVNWLLDGLVMEGFTFVQPAELLALQGTEYAQAMGEALSERESAKIGNGLNGQSPQASVITGVPVAERAVSLVVEGSADPETLSRVLEVLSRHGVTATFFLPAAQAAARTGMLKGMREQGHGIGNYMLEGEKYPENMDGAAAVTSIYRAQKLLAKVSGGTPVYFKGNTATYTPELLRAVKAAGLEWAVRPSAYVNHTSF
ncbi:MAG TPA: polysaccharide deacetylase family protein, partial [Candidatus Limnocylindria bacterium]|nr:polysaccharide deacetylase family protein [Candidatus Limnocylindria bacterium]